MFIDDDERYPCARCKKEFPQWALTPEEGDEWECFPCNQRENERERKMYELYHCPVCKGWAQPPSAVADDNGMVHDECTKCANKRYEYRRVTIPLKRRTFTQWVRDFVKEWWL